MNISQIEHNITKLLENYNQDTFIYDLLLAYGVPKASITKLQKGGLNLSKNDNEILWKKKLLFRVVATDDLYSTTENYKNQPDLIKHDPRFIITTDYQHILAIDTKTFETLDSKITELEKHFDFFLPWLGWKKLLIKAKILLMLRLPKRWQNSLMNSKKIIQNLPIKNNYIA